MLDRLLAVFENDIDTIERIAEPTIKGHLRAWVRLMQTADEKLDRISAGLLSAAANHPELLKPFSEMMVRRNALYCEEPEAFGPALVILTALDGYWTLNALGITIMQGKEAEIFLLGLSL